MSQRASWGSGEGACWGLMGRTPRRGVQRSVRVAVGDSQQHPAAGLQQHRPSWLCRGPKSPRVQLQDGSAQPALRTQLRPPHSRIGLKCGRGRTGGSFMLRLRTKVNDCEGGRSLSPVLAAAVSWARSQLSPQVSPPQRQHSAPLPAPPGPTCQLCAPAAPSAAGVLHPGTAASRCVFSTILLCFGEVLVCAPSHQPGRAPHRRAAPPAAGCHRHRELCQCSSSFLHELSSLQGLPRCCEARGKRRGTGGGGWSCCSSSAGRP